MAVQPPMLTVPVLNQQDPLWPGTGLEECPGSQQIWERQGQGGRALAGSAGCSSPWEGYRACQGMFRARNRPGARPSLLCPAQGQRPRRAASCRAWHRRAPRSGGSALGAFLEQANISRTLSPDPQQQPGQQGMSGTGPGWHQLEGAAGKTPGKQEGSCF